MLLPLGFQRNHIGSRFLRLLKAAGDVSIGVQRRLEPGPEMIVQLIFVMRDQIEERGALFLMLPSNDAR